MPQPPCCFPPTTAALPSIGNAYNSAMLDGLIHGLSSRRPGRALSRSPWRRRALPGWRGHQMARRRRLLSASHRITPPASIATTRAMQLLNEFPKPTIALVHGACFGGGVGLVCCVDVAFTTRITVGRNSCWCRARADLHPYGQRHRPAAYTRYALIGERFDAAEAERNGLNHEVVPADAMGRPQSRRPKAASSRPTTCCWMSARSPCWRTRAGRSAPRRRGSKAPPPSGRSAKRHGMILFAPTCS